MRCELNGHTLQFLQRNSTSLDRLILTLARSKGSEGFQVGLLLKLSLSHVQRMDRGEVQRELSMSTLKEKVSEQDLERVADLCKAVGMLDPTGSHFTCCIAFDAGDYSRILHASV